MLPTRAKYKQADLPIRPFLFLLVLAHFTIAALSQAPDANPYFARKNTFSFLGAYSNDSSHIWLGVAESRKLVDIGAGYSRRLFVNRIVNWQYSFEILPVALNSDPVLTTNTTETIVYNNGNTTQTITQVTQAPTGKSCDAPDDMTATFVYPTQTDTVVWKNTCSRRWVMGEAISPVGFQWNFMPRKKLQAIVVGHGGCMHSAQPIPTSDAGSFNFTFDIGAGFEMYRSKNRSIRAEYRYHHISNGGTAKENPGIDNGVFQVTYSVGR